MEKLTLSILPETLAVCQSQFSDIMSIAWVLEGDGFLSVTRTTDELSIVCDQEIIPDDIQCEKDWRAFKIESKLHFSLAGILSPLTTPLAEADISVFVVSTFDTDYILVKQDKLEEASAILEKTCELKRP